jgi:CRISPR-associated protein Cmr2
MSQPSHYFAVSLGPIYNTIKQARKTRELWVASYLFSFLMKQLNEHLGADAGCRVLSPVAPPPEQALYGAGVFPDRMYGAMESDNRQHLTNAIASAIADVRTATEGYGAPAGFRGDHGRFAGDVISEAFWEKYFRIVHVVVPAKDYEETDANLLFDLNERLDSLELQPRFFAEEPNANGLSYLLEHPYRTRLAKEGLPRLEKGAYRALTHDIKDLERFPSTAEVGSLQLHQIAPAAYAALLKEAEHQVTAERTESKKHQEENDDQAGENDDILRRFYALIDNPRAKLSEDVLTAHPEAAGQLTELHDSAQPYHKYYCIVHADGDNFGNTIKELGSDTKAVAAFSAKLTDYAVRVVDTINDYGGKPVYVGGDDLLFLAPVVSNVKGQARTVFDLIAHLDQDFATLNLGADLPKAKQPTMSYGLTVSYYKFPLFEALQLSYEQLFYRAKKTSWQRQGIKNTVAFRLLKHSGSYFEGLLHKPLLGHFNNELARAFISPLVSSSSSPNQKAKFLSSFAFKLRELEDLLVETTNGATSYSPPQPNQPPPPEDNVDYFFENYFNEPLHRRYKRERNLVKEFVRHAYSSPAEIEQEYPDPPYDLRVTDNFYAIIRLLDFMTPKTKTPAAPIAPEQPAHA